MSLEFQDRRTHVPFYKRLLQQRDAMVGLVLLLILVFTVVAAPLLTSKDPLEINPSARFQPPSWENPMGTDNVGRDIYTRFLYGGRISLRVGLIATTLGAAIGIVLGVFAGFYGGRVDGTISWAIEVLLAFPGILLALAVIATLGPGLTNMMIAVGIAFIPSFMRLARAEVLHVREQQYMEAARSIGAKDLWMMRRHILPYILRPLLVLATLGIGNAILAGAALSFLGLGTQPPTPEWGVMLSSGRSFIRQAWWITVFPGLGIFLTILAVNLFGDRLGDILAADTQLHKQGEAT
ncbi:MAG: ABC transporter permease [Chloroflexi bacterium]|nr:ABC transporter permease [Chloroflexota bacterium]